MHLLLALLVHILLALLLTRAIFLHKNATTCNATK
jgi:hypothetical protein